MEWRRCTGAASTSAAAVPTGAGQGDHRLAQRLRVDPDAAVADRQEDVVGERPARRHRATA